MDDITIHNIVKIESSDVIERTRYGKKYWVKHLNIINDEGHETSMTLFTNEEGALKITKLK